MASLALGLVGAGIGSAIGGTFLGMSAASIGWAVGSTVGGMLFAPDGEHTSGPRLNELRVQSSSRGAPIPTVYGTSRIAGNLIWSGGIKETSHVQETGGGKGGGGGGSHTTYTYDCSFAVGLCEGEIVGIRRIWADSILIYSKSDTATADELAVSDQAGITVFTGSEEQTPASIIEAVEGVGNVPAFRGMAYVLFDQLQLEKHGNRIPNITCEVVASGSYTGYTRVTPIVKAPGTWGQIRNCYGLSGSSVLFIDPEWDAGTSTLTVKERAMDTDGNITEAGITFDHVVGNLSFFDLYGTPTYIPLGMRPGYYALPIATSISGFWWHGTELYEAGNSTPIYSSPITQDVHGAAGYPTTYWGYGGGYYWYHYLANNNVNTPVYKRVQVSSGIALDYDAPNVIDPNSNVDSSRMFCDDNYTYFTGQNTIDGGDTGRIFRYAIDGITPIDFIRTPVHPSKLFLDYNNPGVIYFPYANQIRYISFEDPVMRTMPQQSGISYERIQELGPYFANESLFWSGDSAYHWASYNGPLHPGIWEMHSKYLQVDVTNLADITLDLCSEVGLEASSIDVAALVSTEVKGYVRTSRMTSRACIAPLINAYQLTAIESDYKLKFELLTGVYDTTATESDLAAHETGDLPDKLKIVRREDTELPRRVIINYSDYDGDYQVGIQQAQRVKLNG